MKHYMITYQTTHLLSADRIAFYCGDTNPQVPYEGTRPLLSYNQEKASLIETFGEAWALARELLNKLTKAMPDHVMRVRVREADISGALVYEFRDPTNYELLQKSLEEVFFETCASDKAEARVVILGHIVRVTDEPEIFIDGAKQGGFQSALSSLAQALEK